MTPNSPKLLPPVDRIAVWFASGWGVGWVRVAPGTWGTALGVLLAWGLDRLLAVEWVSAVTLVLCFAGIPICTRAVRAMGGQKDPGWIVFDEIASVPLVFWGVAVNDWRIAIAGFALHRLFDISKPPPARQLERLPEGLGIMADDWIAALYANLVLRILLRMDWL